MNVPRKYGLLRVIAFVLKLLSWLVLLAGIGGGILVLLLLGGTLARQLNVNAGLLAAGFAGVSVISVIWFVQLFAFGSIISLLIDIEENTRALAGPSPE